jgi:hypothetical protein
MTGWLHGFWACGNVAHHVWGAQQRKLLPLWQPGNREGPESQYVLKGDLISSHQAYLLKGPPPPNCTTGWRPSFQHTGLQGTLIQTRVHEIKNMSLITS